MAEIKYLIKVEKLEKRHGTLMGWGMLTKWDGKEYVDSDGDAFEESDVFGAFVDFADSAKLGVMHEKEDDGSIMSLMPLTTEVQGALGIESDKAGLALIVKPSQETMARYETGELTGFSIGGTGYCEEV